MAELANNKKAVDTVILELKDLSTIADYFVICSGDNTAQIKAIAESIDEYFSKKKVFPIGKEGLDFARWVLIDYGDISGPSGDPHEPRKRDDWMGVLQSVINGFDVTRHTLSNFRFVISDDEISCRAYLTADHVIFNDLDLPFIGPEEVVTVVGEYNNHYRKIDGKWKIIKSALDVNWSSGNLGLFETAGQRTAAQTAG